MAEICTINLIHQKKIVMNKLILSIAFSVFTSFLFAQVQVDLHQTKGAFTTESVSLAAGSYQFNIFNDDVESNVGFVLVPKGMYDQSKHIKEAYVKAPVATGKSSMTLSLIHI